MATSTQITNTQIFTFITVLVKFCLQTEKAIETVKK